MRGQPAFDSTLKDFFDPKDLEEIFQTIDGWPNPSHKKLTLPDLDQKLLTL